MNHRDAVARLPRIARSKLGNLSSSTVYFHTNTNRLRVAPFKDV